MVDKGALTSANLAKNVQAPEDSADYRGFDADQTAKLANVPQATADHFADALQGILDGVKAPKDAYDGKFDPLSDEGIHRAMGTAGLAMTGGMAGGPEGALGSGPIRAYHGSPHDFDRFDISKIGTGEGAQAYGHGLYFADNEAVAKAYRDSLSPSWSLKNGRKNLSPQTLPEQFAHNFLKSAYSDGGNAPFVDAVNMARQSKTSEVRAALPEIEEILQTWNRSGVTGKPSGKMYEVNLHADPERLLDWDKPLHEQAGVKPILDEMGVRTEKAPEWALFGRNVGGRGEDYHVNNGYFIRDSGKGVTFGRGSPFDGEVLGKAKNMQQAQDALRGELQPRPLFGHEVMRNLKMETVGAGPDFGSQASHRLREAGIPGVRYLDGGSRGVGDGSRNYVMFDDKPVEIVRKYARGGPVDELDAPSHAQRVHEPDTDLLDYVMNQQAAREQGSIPAPSWAGDLSGVRLVPPRPVKKAEGGFVDGQNDADDGPKPERHYTEAEINAALEYLARLQGDAGAE